MLIDPMNKLEIQLAVEKINKYASAESGDTVELVERPHGGISIVVADGQRSGRSAKAISNIVVRKAISLLSRRCARWCSRSRHSRLFAYATRRKSQRRTSHHQR